MKSNRSRDTKPEIAVRKRLHAAGLRYRVDYRLLPQMLFAADRGNATVVNGEGDGALENVDGEIEVWFSREGTPVSVPLTLEDINDSATEATLDLADGILALNDEADAMHEHWFRRYDADHRPS